MSVLVKEPDAIVETAAGYSEATVRALSAARNEPEWMLEFRLEAWRQFEAMPWPKPTDEPWRRTRLTGFNLKNFRPHAAARWSRRARRAQRVDPARTGRDGQLRQPRL